MLNQVVVDNKIVNEKMKHELDISSLLPGNYFLQLTYGDKIIVKRFTVLR